MSGRDGSPRIVVREPNCCALVLVVMEPLEIGRECSGLLVRDAAISRRHLLVEPTADGVLVTDLESRNGSTIGHRALRPRHRLMVGETIEFGACTLTALSSRTARTQADTREVREIRLAPEVPPAEGFAGLRWEDALGGAEMDIVDGLHAIVVGDFGIEPGRRPELGSTRWRDTLHVHRLIVRGMVRRHRGIEAWSEGVGFVIVFRSASSAVAFAHHVHQAAESYSAANPQAGVHLRMAIDLVETALRPERFDHGGSGGPRRAVRLCQAARDGETLLGTSVGCVLSSGEPLTTPSIARFPDLGEEYAFVVLRAEERERRR